MGAASKPLAAAAAQSTTVQGDEQAPGSASTSSRDLPAGDPADLGFLAARGRPADWEPRPDTSGSGLRPAGSGVVATARALLAEAVLLLDDEAGPASSGAAQQGGRAAAAGAAKEEGEPEPQGERVADPVTEPQTPKQVQWQQEQQLQQLQPG